VTPEPPRPASALADWRAFAGPRYRSFRVLSVAQGFIGSLSGPAIVIPFLLALGAHPALAILLAVLPTFGTMVQRLMPQLLARVDGNLRGVVLAAATIGEPRGLLLAVIAASTQAGLIPNWAAITLVGLVMATFGSLGAIGYGSLQAWYQIILPDRERRLVVPRLQGITLGIGSLILFPLALVIDDAVARIGVTAYAAPFVVAGLAGVVAAFALRRLPPPGHVSVPNRPAGAGADDGRLSRLGRVFTLASAAGGLTPVLSVYVISVLHTGPGFAIAVSAASAATLVLASVWVSSHLVRGSSSRLLRRSQFVRAAALALGLTAHPANPLAPLVVMVIAVLLAAGDTAGQLAANERLFRLATGPSVITFQSRYVIRNVMGYFSGLLTSSAVLLIGGYPAFAILFAGAGTVRLVAARFIDTGRGEVGTQTQVLAAAPDEG
jgi:hypothetical protein